MKCPQCDVEPMVREGKPVKVGDGAYWVQVFTCRNQSCANHDKDIGEVRTNIFDNADVQEIYY